MDITIRQETPADFAQIHELVRLAFQTATESDGDEQDHVLALRASDNYLPELALVAVRQDQLVGHIMLTKTRLHQSAKNFVVLLLSPICVKQEDRGKGIARQLIDTSLKIAHELGYRAVFLVGEPAFYLHFGFVAARTFKIRDTGNIPEEYVLALELEKSWLADKGGWITIC
jgi:predicted N-acetyltransferase YhbS